MADRKSHIRGLIYDEAKTRGTEGLLDDNGLPDCQRIAERVGVSYYTILRIMKGERPSRQGALRPRYRDYRESPELVSGLARWLNLDEEDVGEAIKRSMPIPPFLFPKGPKPKNGRRS